MLTFPVEENATTTDRPLRCYFGHHRLELSDGYAVEFPLPDGEMIALLRRSGVAVHGILEIRTAR